MESSGILSCLNSYSFKNEILLFNRYVWDNFRRSNGILIEVFKVLTKVAKKGCSIYFILVKTELEYLI